MRALQTKSSMLTRSSVGLACLCLLALQTSVLAQPHAIEPLPSPLYSIDPQTPLSAALTAGSALSKPGPSIAIEYVGLGLTAEDDLNGLSFNKSLSVGSLDMFVLVFGVDRETVGGVAPDPLLVADERPFNVQDQANRNQEAGDLFVTLDLFDTAGVVDTIGPRTIYANNTLALNQGDTGGVDQDLSPELAPAVEEAGGPPDNADSAAYPPPARTGPVFYTISRNSSSPISPASVIVDVDPDFPGQEDVFATAADLGLLDQGPDTPDDIDALVVFDMDADNQFDVGIDMILYSLERNSPSLALRGASAADVFISRGGGISMLYAEAYLLGLDPTLDNVDCLEVFPTTIATRSQDVRNWSIFLVWPGDVDGNALLDEVDCQGLPPCFTGSDAGPALAGCEVYDIDYDGDVDCDDVKYFRSVYAEATIGCPCVMLSVEDFVIALLQDDATLPQEIFCFADMNADDRVDGDDIPLFVRSMLK